MRRLTYPLIVIVLVVLALPSFARPAETSSFPYTAEITGTDVYVRSGPGTNYYRCTKLNKPDRITVVAHDHSWSKIVPPPDCFSWISTQYIKSDPADPTTGIVTGNKVRIWAGSSYLEPIHSTRLQRWLNVGDTVKLLGEEKAGYYKIAPPPETYFYVSTEFTKPVESGELAKPAPAEKKPAPAPGKLPAPAMGEKRPAPAPPGTAEAGPLKKYYQLAEKVELERKKPLAQQDYSKLKQAFEAIANDPASDKAARYAVIQLKAISRFEAALQVQSQIENQDAQLARARQQIRADLQAKLNKIVDLGKFAVIGTLRRSQVYTAPAAMPRFTVLDQSGKRICYAQPLKPMEKASLNEALGKKVGLVGTITPDPQTSTALVRFSQIVVFK